MKRPSKKNAVGCLVAIGLMIGVCIPLCHIWVGHIPEKYSYNKKLPEPSQIVSWVNMNSGIVQKQLDRRILQMREELDSASFEMHQKAYASKLIQYLLKAEKSKCIV